MAFTKNPTVSTYDTQRVPLIFSPQQRGSTSTKDARLENMLVEEIEAGSSKQRRFFVKSRPGLSTVYSNTAGEARGLYLWNISGTDYTLSVVGNTVYNGTTSVLTLTTSTGPVGFTEFLKDTGVVSLILVDGTKGYVFSDASTAVEITAVDFPTPHIPMPIFLDGYLFLAKSNTADIYNSNLNDPSLWTVGDFITAEMYPDKVIALTKNNNHVYAVGSQTIEYFFDAANATGSPLARVAEAVQQFGSAAPQTVLQTDREVVLVGNSGNGGHSVWTIDGFKEKEISIPSVKYALTNEGTAISSAKAFCVRVTGQKLYVLSLATRTFVYSFDTDMWHEWSSASGRFLAIYGTDGPGSSAYVQGATDGKVYALSELYFTDSGTAFTCSLTTQKYDFDSMNRKFMYRLSLVGDVPDDAGAGNALTVQWSDDDYKTWSSSRTLNLGRELPSIFQLGTFRRRAFKVSYPSSFLLRLEGLEVDINKGSA